MSFLDRNAIVPALFPVDLSGGPLSGDYVSLKNYGRCVVNISIGVTTGTCVVTLKQATAVAGTGAKALAFTTYRMTGTKLKFKSATGRFTVGETVTGASGSGVVYKDNGDYLLFYTVNASAFVDGETITGGTSGVTATADGIGVDEDMLIKCTCSSTFTIPAVSARKYAIEIDARDLDIANGYDCMMVYFADANAGCIGGADYILSQPRYSEDPMPSAIYD